MNNMLFAVKRTTLPMIIAVLGAACLFGAYSVGPAHAKCVSPETIRNDGMCLLNGRPTGHYHITEQDRIKAKENERERNHLEKNGRTKADNEFFASQNKK